MEALIRRSPIKLPARPERTEERDGWKIVVNYQDQGDGPHLVDLSHVYKWDLQSSDLAGFSPGGLSVPEKPGVSALKDGWLVNRMNNTQASVWRLGGNAEASPDPAREPAYTETTDAQALIALIGPKLAAVVETITSLDVFAPGVEPPALVQGPVLHIPCQVVRLGEAGERGTILIAFSRGYGQAMAEAVLEAGRPYGLTPGGEEVFTNLMTALGG